MLSGRHFYCNTLFDLQLGGYPTGSLNRTALEMTTLFIPLMQQGDTVQLDVALCEGYETYLYNCGLGPQIGKSRFVSRFLSEKIVVWGQDDIARRRITDSLQTTPDFPSIDIVRKINSRRFCNELGLNYGCGVSGSRFCTLPEDVYSFAQRNADSYPLVVKAAHGGFGAGIHRVASAEKLRECGKLVEKYLSHGGLVIEPWLERSADISTSLEIGHDGSISDVTIQLQRINRYGGFYGIEAPVDETIQKKWGEELCEKTTKYAAEAARCGYFGPFGCDSFIVKTGTNDEKLVFGIEINARFTMGIFAHCIRNLIAKGNYSLLRLVSRKKGALSQTYEEWMEQSSEFHFSSAKKEGVVLLTPLQVGINGVFKQPQLNIFFLFGETRRSVKALDQQLQVQLRHNRVT